MSANQEASSPKTKAHFNRRSSRGKLPTPPPDPNPDRVSDPSQGPHDNAEDFISTNALEYINSLQKTMFTSVIATEDAFDHLDKLYKLMEQMLDLRQQNARLLSRIRDLEHLKKLETMHHQLGVSGSLQDFSERDDTIIAESLLDSMLNESKNDFKNKLWGKSIVKRQINVSDDDTQIVRKASVCSVREKTSKVSKWTKVKAAFRWEKASSSVTGAKSQDSGLGGMTPINYEVARYLRVPSSDEAGNSPADSGAADGSTPGSLSSASSNDDVHHHHSELRRDSRVSHEDRRHYNSRKEQHRGKSYFKKGGIPIQAGTSYQEHIFDSSTRSDDERIDVSDKEHSANSQNSSTKSSKQRQRRYAKKGIPDDVVERYQKAVADDEYASKHRNRKRISKWIRVKKAFLNPTVYEERNKPSHLDRQDVALYKTNDERNKIQEEIQDNYKELQNKLSLEFKCKLVGWEKSRAGSSGTTSNTYSRIDSVGEETRDSAFVKKMENWEKIKNQPVKQAHCAQLVREEDLPQEFRKKLEEWQRIKKCPIKDEVLPGVKTKKKLGEWPKWKSVSSHREEHPYNASPPLSDDFLKKLQDWRKIKENRHDAKEKTPSPIVARKLSLTNTSPTIKHNDIYELQWFESELDKIEIERKRLEAERQKFLQREERLSKLRRTVLGNESKKDVLIHTPAGFYKFEGISRKFTQRLCEWEASQGIGPEASTFALLTSKCSPKITVNMCETKSEDCKTCLHRSKSAESVSVSNLNEVFQTASHHPSSLSLNDIDELERQCLALSSDSSYQDVSHSLENVDNDEPEAVIVEVEDEEEETAAPLEEYLQEKHFPIYQRERTLNTCEKQQVVVPHVLEVNNSNNPHYCSYLLDEILRLAERLEDDELTLCHVHPESRNGEECKSTNSQLKEKPFNAYDDNNTRFLDVLHDKLARLQEMHSKNVVEETQMEEQKPTSTRFADLLDLSLDIFRQLFQMIEQHRNKLKTNEDGNISQTNNFVGKLNDLKRIFTYFYADFDMTFHRPRGSPRETQCDSKITPQIFDESDQEQDGKDIKVDPAIIEKLVISTNANYLTHQTIPTSHKEPASIFVNTTRRLFTPLEQSKTSSSGPNCPKRPVLPLSPTTQRKLAKEISPGIRVMLAKYNQMVSGHDCPKAPNSGSSSPTAWRSPVSERRVRARRERYLEELSKLKGPHEVVKSASSAVLNLTGKSITSPQSCKGILRSTSACVIPNDKVSPFEIEIRTGIVRQASEERYNKLLKVKEEFMRSPEVTILPPEPSSAPPMYSKELIFPPRSRYSQASMGSESSYDSNSCTLIKSASAGMLHTDEDSYRQRNPGLHHHGYLSLPRVAPKQKSGLLGGLSNIAAKFRKVKMKRNKKMNTVSELCRQSLVVDLHPGSQDNVSLQHMRHDSLTVPTPSSSEDTSPSSSRSGSWIRRSKIFKAL